MVAHIVNSENDGYGKKLLIGGVGRSQQNWDQPALPIVTVDHIRQPKLLGQLDGYARKLRKAFGIVRVIAAGDPVKLVPIEIVGIVHEEILDASRPAAVGDGGKAQGGTHGNTEALDEYVLNLDVTRPWQND